MLWEIPLRYLPGLQRTKKVGNRYSIAAICNPTTSRCQTLQARSLTDEWAIHLTQLHLHPVASWLWKVGLVLMGCFSSEVLGFWEASAAVVYPVTFSPAYRIRFSGAAQPTWPSACRAVWHLWGGVAPWTSHVACWKRERERVKKGRLEGGFVIIDRPCLTCKLSLFLPLRLSVSPDDLSFLSSSSSSRLFPSILCGFLLLLFISSLAAGWHLLVFFFMHRVALLA